MALDPRNQEWLSHNSVRSYPLTADATKLDLTGLFRIPDDFIVGLYLTIPSGNSIDPSKFHVYKIGAFTTGYSITIGYDGTPVASALLATVSHVKNTPYSLGGLGDFTEVGGHVVIGDLGNISKQPAGQFEFDLTGGLLEVDSIRPDLRSVTSISVQNGEAISEPFYGHIVLRAGANVRITPTDQGDYTLFTFDGIEGEGFNEPCVCSGDIEATPIYTINGVGPTAAGDFRFEGGDCVDVEPVTNGIQIIDTCAKPCCGCTELNTIVQAMETFAAQLATLGQFLAGLESATTGTQGNLLASTLGDRGCNSCDEATEI
jgi:hypothetical protein